MRLATPAALVFLIGLALVYFALRGWDRKYGTFGGAFTGETPIAGGTNGNGSVPSIA